MLWQGVGSNAKLLTLYTFYFMRKPGIEDVLTTTEFEILQQLNQGLMYKEIADLRKVKIDTIKKHASNAYRKLGVRNKTEACNAVFH